MSEPFGVVLTRLRGRRSQSSIARGAELNHSHVSRLETGDRMPTREAVDRIADSLSCDDADRDALLASAGFLPDHVNLAPSCPAAWVLDDLHRTADDATKRRIEALLAGILGVMTR